MVRGKRERHAEGEHGLCLEQHAFFLRWRKEIYDRFAGLFTGDAEDIDSDRADAISGTKSTGRKTIEEVKAEMEADKLDKWAWIGVIYRLCAGDITKTDKVVNKPFTECLVWLSYEKEVLQK